MKMMQGKIAKVGLTVYVPGRARTSTIRRCSLLRTTSLRQDATKTKLELKAPFNREVLKHGKLLTAQVMQLELLFHMNAIFVTKTLNCVICVKTGPMPNIYCFVVFFSCWKTLDEYIVSFWIINFKFS